MGRQLLLLLVLKLAGGLRLGMSPPFPFSASISYLARHGRPGRVLLQRNLDS